MTERDALHRALLEDINIEGFDPMPAPCDIRSAAPASERALAAVAEGRSAIRSILDGNDSRLMIITGPCSIHDPKAAMDYASRLAALQQKVSRSILLVMRVYFEKPRTVTGWKGYINDPFLNNTFQVVEGMKRARSLMVAISELGLPIATEALDPFGPQYYGDLVSWYAIGARTSESQTHREMASGLSAPVGFKNATDGNLDVSINAIKASRRGHHFIGVYEDGRSAVVRTRGNAYGHLVLRGGGGRPNYDTVSVMLAEKALEKAGLTPRIVIDCSHANSMKKPELQPLVFADCLNQIAGGSRSICGLMLESNINAGNQSIPEDLSLLKYGVSVTDACINWETTQSIICEADRVLSAGREAGSAPRFSL
ncbi:MAG: 3-deoxy-7-phosphoheptulonate synthase [Duodenibacillus sp.]|nr:3-deoxy-7-phosphoheptulonate synthase [Duodenibacillus sp.]